MDVTIIGSLLFFFGDILFRMIKLKNKKLSIWEKLTYSAYNPPAFRFFFGDDKFKLFPFWAYILFGWFLSVLFNIKF
jgi:hypothetical protein